MQTDISPEWIALDWGTTNLRAWAMHDSAVLDKAASADGMSTLAKDAFEPTLSRVLQGWQVTKSTPIIACGMVGSRQGWVEAPYRPVPCTPLGPDLARPDKAAFDLRVIPGLRQNAPADVMRGEETQIAGFLALNSGWDGVICLPGTHAKWVHISAGEVVSFQTYMTGELFALLAQASVLRHSVNSTDWDDTAFAEAVEDSLSRPEKIAAKLFSIRARDLLEQLPPARARAILSGLLIGAELAASKPYWLGQNLAILGATDQARHYASALAAQGAMVTVADAERMTIAGLTAAYRQIGATL